MLTSTITDNFSDSLGPISGSLVIARLRPVGGFRVDDLSSTVDEVRTNLTSDGNLILELERNGNITPANTYWEVEVRLPRTRGNIKTYAIVVGDSDAVLSESGIITIPEQEEKLALTLEAGDVRYVRRGASNIGAQIDVKDYGAIGDGVVNDSVATTLAAAAAGVQGEIIFSYPGTYLIDDDLTITSGVKVDPGALIKPDENRLITLLGFINARWYKIFDLSATNSRVRLNNTRQAPFAVGPRYGRLEWWGAEGNNQTIDTVAVKAAVENIQTHALDEGAVIELRPGAVYYIDDSIIFSRGFFELKWNGAAFQVQAATWQGDIANASIPLRDGVLQVGELDREITNLTTVDGSPIVNSPDANFTPRDENENITGAGIPASSYITRINSPTQAVMSANATASAVITATMERLGADLYHSTGVARISGAGVAASFGWKFVNCDFSNIEGRGKCGGLVAAFGYMGQGNQIHVENWSPSGGARGYYCDTSLGSGIVHNACTVKRGKPVNLTKVAVFWKGGSGFHLEDPDISLCGTDAALNGACAVHLENSNGSLIRLAHSEKNGTGLSGDTSSVVVVKDSRSVQLEGKIQAINGASGNETHPAYPVKLINSEDIDLSRALLGGGRLGHVKADLDCKGIEFPLFPDPAVAPHGDAIALSIDVPQTRRDWFFNKQGRYHPRPYSDRRRALVNYIPSPSDFSAWTDTATPPTMNLKSVRASDGGVCDEFVWPGSDVSTGKRIDTAIIPDSEGGDLRIRLKTRLTSLDSVGTLQRVWRLTIEKGSNAVPGTPSQLVWRNSILVGQEWSYRDICFPVNQLNDGGVVSVNPVIDNADKAYRVTVSNLPTSSTPDIKVSIESVCLNLEGDEYWADPSSLVAINKEVWGNVHSPGPLVIPYAGELTRHISAADSPQTLGLTPPNGDTTWRVGDICWNSAPASTEPMGWTCTVAGSPGTWAAFGTIA